MFLRGQNDEGIMEDDQGVMVAKMKEKASLKDWIEKIFTDPANSSKANSRSSPSSSISLDSLNSQTQWEANISEIETYFQQLSSSDLDEDNQAQENSPMESDMPEDTDSNMVINCNITDFIFCTICGYNCKCFYYIIIIKKKIFL